MKRRLQAIAFPLLIGLIVYGGMDTAFRLGGALTTPLEAQSGSSTTAVLETYDYEAITVSTVSKTFTAAKLNPTNPVQPSAKAVFCTTETSGIRFREDGTAPTSTEGHLIPSGSSFTVFGINNLNRWKAIRDTGAAADATLRCSYRR